MILIKAKERMKTMEEIKETTRVTGETMEQKVYRKMRTGLTREQAVNSVKREEAKRARSKKPTEVWEHKGNPAGRFITAEAWSRGIRFEDLKLSKEELIKKYQQGKKR